MIFKKTTTTNHELFYILYKNDQSCIQTCTCIKNMFQQFKYICTTFYNLFFNCRTNRKYRSKIIYRIRTCLPFRARIVSTNYHQCWIDDQFEEKALLKVSVTPIIKEFHCTYMLFFFIMSCFRISVQLTTCLFVCKILSRMNIWLYLNTVHIFRKLIVQWFFFSSVIW